MRVPFRPSFVRRTFLTLVAIFSAMCRESTTTDSRALVNRSSPSIVAPNTTQSSAVNAVLEALSPVSRQRVRTSPVAVLLPSDARQLTAAVVTVGEHWYALHVPLAGHTIYLSATDIVHDRVPDDPTRFPRATVRQVPALFTLNEGIRSVAWEQAGVYYALEVECEDPLADVHCASENYLRAVAESLIPVRVGQ